MKALGRVLVCSPLGKTLPILLKNNTCQQRLQEQGIHPPLEKLIYLTKEEFEFFKRLRGRFLKRAAKFFKEAKESRQESPEKFVEQRSLTVRDTACSAKGFIYRRELLSKNWERVKEYYREMTEAERYEQLCKEIEI